MPIRDADFEAPQTTTCAHCGGEARRVQGATYGAKAWDAIDYLCSDCGKGGHIAERSGRRAGPVFEGTTRVEERLVTDGGEPVDVERADQVEPVEVVGTQITAVRDGAQTPHTIVATVVFEAGDSRGEIAARYRMDGSTAVLHAIETAEGQFFVADDPDLIREADRTVQELEYVQAVTGFDRAVRRVETDGGRVQSAEATQDTDDEEKDCCPRCGSSRLRYRKPDDTRGRNEFDEKWRCKVCKLDFDEPDTKVDDSNYGIRGPANTLEEMDPDDWPPSEGEEVDR